MARKSEIVTVDALTGEVVGSVSATSKIDFGKVTNIEQALALLAQHEVEVTEYGDGFTLTDKADLVGVNMVITDWTFNVSDRFFDEKKNGLPFVSVRGVTDNSKFVFNDGSAGVYAQLLELTEHLRVEGAPYTSAPLSVKGGLRVSEYEYEDPNTGKTSEASTYYLAT